MKPLLLVLLGWWQFQSYERCSAAFRHFSLLVVMVGLPLLILLQHRLALVQVPLVAPGDWLQASFAEAWQWPWVRAALLMWLLVVVWRLARLLLGVLILAGRGRHYREDAGLQAQADSLRTLAGVRRYVRVRVSAAASEPHVWGWSRPTLVLPPGLQTMTVAQQRLVLLHELGHVARGDWLTSLVVEGVVTLFWFVPGLRRLQCHLAELTEQACDDWVLAQGGSRPAYAQMLADLAAALYQQTLPAQFMGGRGSEHYRRVMALLDGGADHGASVGGDGWRLLLVGVLWLLPLVLVQATVKPLPLKIDRVAGSSLPLVVTAPETRPLALAPDSVALTSPVLPVAQAPAVPAALTMLQKPAVIIAASDANQFPHQLVRPVLAPRIVVQGYLPQRTVIPEYPRRALRAGIEGRVIVQFSITPAGEVVAPRIAYASPEGVFERVVLQAIAGFTFVPQRVNGEAVTTSYVTEEFVFSLRDSAPDTRRRSSPPVGQTAIALKY